MYCCISHKKNYMNYKHDANLGAIKVQFVFKKSGW